MSQFNTEEDQKLTEFLRCYSPATPPAPSNQAEIIWEAINTQKKGGGRWWIPVGIITGLALMGATVAFPKPIFRYAQQESDLDTFMVEAWEKSLAITDDTEIHEDYLLLTTEF
ncbi:MAG: hypothetical protein IGQ45_00345 [Cyanobacterium sp. T60_A2020_053]|nr:hypothetical protein [Cyanobacterium sp. T60_A2020_053]